MMFYARNLKRLGAALWILLSLVVICHAQEQTKKVSKSDGINAATAKVQPEYPAIARQLKIEGAVELEAVVSESGTVEKVNILSGNPVLTKPAADALRKWKFAPFSAEGKVVKALVPVSLNFKM